MNLIKWKNNDIFDPISEFDRLQQEINKLFDFERTPLNTGLFERRFSPAIDILETEEEFKITCDLPGVEEKDLDLSLAGNVLTLKGSKEEAKESKEAKVYRRETWSGNFQRTVSLPETIDPDTIQAELKNGLLTLRIKKRDEVKPKQIPIKIK